MRTRRFALALLLFSTATIDRTARADGVDTTGAPYFLVRKGGSAEVFPMKATRADIAVAGVIAHVRVTQVYENAGSGPIEAEYVFPASTRAAVSSMRMKIGERTIEALIEKRSNARRLYARAKEEGRSASLLEEKRDNVFQMSVANILPGDRVEVALEYAELLVPQNGVYELAYPTVVGPRYVGAQGGEGWTHNPHLAEGSSPPYRWSLSAKINAGMPIADVASPSHRIVTHFTGASTVHIETDDETGGDRDFILRYRLGGEKIETGLLLLPGKDENHFLMMMQPPERMNPSEIPPREYVFVVDVSGSMTGFPIEIARDLMRKLLSNLRGEDLFNVILFSGGNTVMSERSLPASQANIERAETIVDSMHGGGGTELLPALDEALSLPRSSAHATTIVVITDGYVPVEKETFARIRRNLKKANLFAFGIGSSVNRQLIEGMARAGMAEPFVVTSPTEAKASADRFRTYIESPVLSHIEASFEGFDAYEVEPDPKAIADLFASRPIILSGKYRGVPTGRIVIRGENASGSFVRTMDVGTYSPSDDNRALPLLWARRRIERLSDDLLLGDDEKTKGQILALGLRYRLLTTETSFVAIDTIVRNHGQKVEHVRQPLPLPRGVSNAALDGVGAGMLGMSSFGSGAGGGGVSLQSALPSTIMGSLDRSVIQRVIESNAKKRVRACYLWRLSTHPDLSGRIVVKMTIGPDGHVTRATLEGHSMNDPEIEACILGVMKQLVFPVPTGGGEVQVNYPFIFATE
jgi:Ca-activated chloride channel family protein